MTHEQILEKFLKALGSAHHLSPCTVTGYRWKLTPLFERWADKPMKSWSYGDWEDYLAHNDQWGSTGPTS